ncbi:putative leucine-rich repeat domain, L domain-containing protein [Medicago truncatula]|uniref:Putative leucine-rich repeat domain, L domain-containing protein n=1 Tax=Medicago truncatula TaxID=3880 RepID=A0A396I6V9_MEDTR|nr:putative leucine-rich repeat domain, L domain-containing protein [Medicago truncatula]
MVYRHRCRVGLLRQKLECEPNSCQSSPPPTSTRAGDRLGVEDWQQGGGVPQLSLSKYFYLPALRTLHLEYFYFAATNSHCADPFSNCLVLNTLVLGYCCLIKETQVLCISNYTLSHLTLTCISSCRLSLSTPNLSYFTVSGHMQFFFS